MLNQQTFEKLSALKWHGMARALEEQLRQPAVASLSFEERLAMLVDAQWLWRENRALASRLHKAQLKFPAAMEDINYRQVRGLDRSLMGSLAGCQWVGHHQNVLLTGPAGIGKTYLCCALLEKACRQGYTAYYIRAPQFFRKLALAAADGSFDKLLVKLAKTDVLGIDDWGLSPLSDSERRHFLEVIEDRHGSRSTVLASQFPVDTWHDLIANPSIADATLDRLLHQSHRIELEGESMRRTDSKKAASDRNSQENPQTQRSGAQEVEK